MFNEVWRFERDYFMTPNHAGQDLAALKKMYAAYLPNVVTRRVLESDFFNEMLSHLQLAHDCWRLAIFPLRRVQMFGLLGADYKIN